MKYKLQDLIDMEHFQNLQERLNEIYSFPSSIIDNEGNILTSTAWQGICTQFHRKNKDCEKLCIQSDLYIKEHIHEANPAVTYRCPHGLVDNATPIIIDGCHYGNFFTGQFFLEEPDMEFFRAQAKKYEFDEDAYLDAVKRVPIWTQKQLDSYLFFIKGLIAVLSESGLKKLKEIENKKRIESNEKRHRIILKSAMDGYLLTNIEGRLLEVNDAYCRMSGYSEDELLTMRVSDLEVTEEPDLVAEHIQTVVLQGSDRFESKHRRKDGTVFDIEASIQFRPEKGGQCVCFFRDITERKKAEKDLKESEERFRYLSDGSMEAIFFTKDGFCLEVNQVAVEIFGYDDRSEFIGMFGTDIIAPESHSIVKSHMLTGTFEPYEAVGMRKDGTRFPISIRAKAMPYKDVGIVRVTSITDITKIKQAEKALRESEEDLKESQRIAHVGSWRLDLTSNQVVWSEELYRLYGLDPTSPPPPYTEHQKLFTAESWSKLSTALNNTKDTGIPYDLELETLREDGKRGWMWVQGEAIHDAMGVVVGLRGAVQDITERKQTEEALKASEKKYHSLFDNAQVALFRNRLSDGKVLEINERYAKMAGYSNIEGCVAEFNAADAWADPNERKELLRILQENGFVSDYETEIIRKDGTNIWISFSATIFPEHGFLEGSIVEITERKRSEIQRKRLQAQLAQAQKMETIGTLAGGIAHDFNNILSPIMGHTEMLLADFPEESPLKFSLGQIYGASLRARDLIQQILTFSRQNCSELKLMKVQHIAKEVLKLIRSVIPASIEIRSDIYPDCSPIKADPTKIHQLIMNLTTNSYHAMKETGGEMTVCLKEVALTASDIMEQGMTPGQYVYLSVSDTGTGIADDIKEKIFDPFFTTKHEGEGTGMGLSVVHGIVKDAGGAIHLESKLGKGSTFHVYLPIAEPHSKPQTELEKEVIKGGTETLLLVDDDEVVINMEKQMLERLGYQVTSSSSSIEALNAFRANPDKFDLVITDMAMPKLSGDKLATEFIKIRPDIPILLCSGFSELMSEEKAQSLGIKGFLMKPIVISDLSKNIRDILDKAKILTQD